MSTFGLTVGLTAASAGASIAIGKQNCEAIGDFNPYQNCISSCKKYPDNSVEQKECIAMKRCNDKDDQTGEPLFKDVNMGEECMKKVYSNQNVQYDMMGIMLVKELMEEVARDYAEKTILKSLGKKPNPTIIKQISQTVSNLGKSIAVKIGLKKAKDLAAEQAAKKSAKIAYKVAQEISQQTAKAIAKNGGKQLSKEVSEEITKKIIQKQASKQATKQVGKKASQEATEAASKKLAQEISKNIAKQQAKQAAKQAAKKAAIKTTSKVFGSAILSIALALLSFIDGIGIVLDFWDPGGFSNVPTNEMLKNVRNSYITMYRKDADNKYWISELYEKEMIEDKKIYDDLSEKYNQTKSLENKNFMDDAKEKYLESKKKYENVRFQGKERPRKHGGIIIYPFDAYPKYPFDESGEFIDIKTEENYYKFIREYINNQQNLVWTYDELDELIEIQKQKEKLEKEKINLLNKSDNNLKKDIEDNIKNLNLLENKIKIKEKIINDMIENGELSEQIEKEKKKLNELKNIKSNINKNISTSKSIILDDKSRNNFSIVNSSNISNNKSRKYSSNIFSYLQYPQINNKQPSFFVIFGIFSIIIGIIIILYRYFI